MKSTYRFKVCNKVLLSLPAKMYQSLLISHWVHEKDNDVGLSLIGAKEMIWIASFELK